MKINAKVGLLLLCTALFALGFVLCLPRRSPDVVVGLLGFESTPNSLPPMPYRLVLSVTNSGATPIEIAVGPKVRRLDWPRGESATLSPGAGHNLHAWVLNLDPPWTISIKSRRIAGKIEKWLRSYGAKLQICDPTPVWRQVQLLEVSANGAPVVH
jgi:hypothetical protein